MGLVRNDLTVRVDGAYTCILEDEKYPLRVFCMSWIVIFLTVLITFSLLTGCNFYKCHGEFCIVTFLLNLRILLDLCYEQFSQEGTYFFKFTYYHPVTVSVRDFLYLC